MGERDSNRILGAIKVRKKIIGIGVGRTIVRFNKFNGVCGESSRGPIMKIYNQNRE